jgi:hypothetical protein
METQYKDKLGNIIKINNELILQPIWSKEDLHCKVIDKENIKWLKKTTLRTELSYWCKNLIII